MRTILTAVIAAALACSIACANTPASPGGITAGGALGIINGSPTGAGSFGNVGALLYDFDANGTLNGNDLLCSGSLISQTVFLTAGHCLSFLPAGSTVHVSFAPDLKVAGITTIQASGYAIDPRYGHDNGDPVDLGVVLLPSSSTAGITPLSLPPAGLLDQMAAQGGLQGQIFHNVGYGASISRNGRPSPRYDDVRQESTSPFMSLQPAWLSLHMNAAKTGLGGDCYGDSGSPKFFAGNATMVLATVSWGDFPCRALSKNYRLDTASARSFLRQYVPLP
jgi:hypothetical protein